MLSRLLSPLRASVLLLVLGLQASDNLFGQDKLLPIFRFQKVEGIFNNQIRSRVVRDQEGFAWVGTLNGLERFDGYSVKDYRNVVDDPHSLSSNYILSLLLDSKGRLWVGTFDAGVSFYDRSTDRFFNFYPRAGDSSWYQAKTILGMMEDRNGDIWIASRNEGVVRLELPRGTGLPTDSLLKSIRFTTYALGTPRNSATGLIEQTDGKIVAASDSGLVLLDPAARSISRPDLPLPNGRLLTHAVVQCLGRDSGDVFWAGTDTEGLFRINLRVRTAQNFRHVDGDTLSILSNNVEDVVGWEGGLIWVGTGEGLQLFSPVDGRGVPYLVAGPNPSTKTWSTMLFVDNTGTFWVGTAEGGVHYLGVKSRRIPFFGLPDTSGIRPRVYCDAVEKDRNGNLWFASGDKIFRIDLASKKVLRAIDVFRGRAPNFADRASFLDRNGTLWYGAWGLGLFRINLESGQVKLYGTEAGLGKSKIVNAIAQASGDSLWIAANNDGLKKFDPVTERFSDVPGFGKHNVWWVMRDRNGMVWVTPLTHGVSLLNPVTGEVQTFRHNPSDPHSLSSDVGRWVYDDPAGVIWIGAGNTINRWDPMKKSFTRYPNLGFEKALFAQPLCSDKKGRLWVDFLNGGLAMLDPSTGAYTNYDVSDGVTANLNVAKTLEDGTIVLTGNPGVNVFHTDSLEKRRPPPPLILTRMSISDEPVAPPYLKNASSSLSLPYSQNVIELEFAAIDIDAPGLVRYQYKLEGLEENWVEPKARRFVRYTGLQPKDYAFKVRAISLRNEWPDQEISLAISIAPPWWRTTWAYLAYVLLVMGLLYVAYRLRLNQFRLKQRAELEHFQAERLAEVDQLKSRFFANISHEFRTPLTLILGPAKQLLENSMEEDTKAKADLIHRSARKLNRLVDELLDISRIEAGEMKLKACPANVVSIVKEMALSFHSLAERKKIVFTVCADESEIIAWMDKEKVEKILSNVLSNAFKFTPEGGKVEVSLRAIPIRRESEAISPSKNEIASSLRSAPRNDKLGFVTISISDTGIGIPADKVEKIFDRFYQVDGGHTREHEGTGIGLSLTKELVELHKGRIEVESEEGKGSTFRLIFPLGKDHLKPEDICEEEQERDAAVVKTDEIVEVEDDARTGIHIAGKLELPTLLLVEDNADVRKYIGMILDNQYRIIESKDGEEGLDRAWAQMPDLIISDIMMPKLDGFQLCKRLKTDARTSHIPVIMLTAKATMGDKLNGLELGADDYIMKPFEASELKARIKNLLDQRKRLQKHFREHGLFDVEEKKVTSVDQKFLKKAVEVIQEHISDTSFGVEAFAEEMAMSRSLLFRKMEALVGEPPSDMIRRTRLNTAAKLLEANAGNVSEIALEVGFSNPSYFAECFRKQFGVTPTQYQHNSHNVTSGQ